MKKYSFRHDHQLVALVFAGVFSVAGYLLLANSRAATSSASVESEAGMRSTVVQQLSDGNASAGAAIRFAGVGGALKPDASNTGYTNLASTYTGSAYNSVSNVTYDGVDFPVLGQGSWYTFTGNNLVFRSCKFLTMSGLRAIT